MSQEKLAKTLGELIDENELPTEYGGKKEVKFNWDLLFKNNEEHRAKIQAEYGAFKDDEADTHSEKSDTKSEKSDANPDDFKIPEKQENEEDK